MVAPADIDGLSNAELKALVVKLLSGVAEEMARLKGLKGRPKVKPSGMEPTSDAKASTPPKERPGGGGKTSRLAIDEERILEAGAPPGSRFKGYEDVIVQDLVLHRQVIRFRRQRWLTPQGTTITAPLPDGIIGHFGPSLRRFILFQYHRGQVTVPRLLEQLRAIGIAISKRQVLRLLIAGKGRFHIEARDVLRAGLATASWITVDDTGARHKGVNGVCTQIGNDHFAWFGTTFSKSRLNFLDLLRAGHGDYVVNEAALDYMRGRAL